MKNQRTWWKRSSTNHVYQCRWNSNEPQDSVQVVRASVKDVRTGESVELDYVKQEKVGSGTFGTVYQAQLVERNEVVAIKEVLQDNRYKVSIDANVNK
jgi:serine/threonine protein kinase